MAEVGVGAIIPDDEGKILLGYRTSECGLFPDSWFIPCGHLKPGESLVEALEREMWEELGVRVRVGSEVYNHKRDGIKGTVFACQITEGTPTNMEPHLCMEIRYVSLRDIDVMEKVHPLLIRIVREYERLL